MGSAPGRARDSGSAAQRCAPLATSWRPRPKSLDPRMRQDPASEPRAEGGGGGGALEGPGVGVVGGDGLVQVLTWRIQTGKPG